MQAWKVGGYFLHNSHKNPYKQTAFLFQQGNNKQKIFITAKGYSNKVHLEHPFFHDRGISAGNPPCKPPLALQVPTVKGLTGSLAFCVWLGWKSRPQQNIQISASENQLHFLESGEIILAKIPDTHPINRHHF